MVEDLVLVQIVTLRMCREDQIVDSCIIIEFVLYWRLLLYIFMTIILLKITKL